MSYCGYITKIKNVRKHSNADRLQVGECFGNFVIVGLDTQDNELGVYFPTDGKLGIEYCKKNNLLREKDENGNNIGGYLDPKRRNISTLKLRGEKSDGLFMPLKSLESFYDISTFKEGDMITTLNGVLICEKYIPKEKKNRTQGIKKDKRKIITSESYPLFEEHIDTAQLPYNLHRFKEGDLCQITLKLHGTSGRVTHTIKEKKKILPYWLYKTLKSFNIELKPKKSWEYVSGTRRVVLKDYDNGYYGDNFFRKQWHDYFKGKLHKGESCYFEIVGYTHADQTIMPSCNNNKTKDKEFIKQYGDTTKFTYGCEEGQSDIYVYRMTITNEDGYVVEYPEYLIKLRCEQMGVKYCPEFDLFIFTNKEDLMERVNKFIDGADPIGKTHTREGVIVRIINRQKFTAFKNKSFNFKVLEGIIKSDDVLDMEEAESIQEDVDNTLEINM
jgi:hypothetical protein